MCSTRSARYRTETAQKIIEAVRVTVLRGNEVRGVESVDAGGAPAELARAAARQLGTRRLGDGPVDRVLDGETVHAVANGHSLMAAITGTGCMSSAVTGCFLAVKSEALLEAATEALVAFGVAGEDAAVGAKGPGSFHVNLYDALANLRLEGRERLS